MEPSESFILTRLFSHLTGGWLVLAIIVSYFFKGYFLRVPMYFKYERIRRDFRERWIRLPVHEKICLLYAMKGLELMKLERGSASIDHEQRVRPDSIRHEIQSDENFDEQVLLAHTIRNYEDMSEFEMDGEVNHFFDQRWMMMKLDGEFDPFLSRDISELFSQRALSLAQSAQHHKKLKESFKVPTRYLKQG